MEIVKSKTVAFTGNRTLKTSTGRPDANLESVLRTEVRFYLEKCYQKGKNTFISGMAIGWDMLCAEEVLKLKTKYNDITLIAAIPFQGQELLYSENDKKRYKTLYEAADHIVYITNGGYDNNAYHKRNDWMIANASELIAYDSHQPRSGTSSTVRKASKLGLFVFNMFDYLEDYFANKHHIKQSLQRIPALDSFFYTSTGVAFGDDDNMFLVNFEQIENIELNDLYLTFILTNGVKYQASLISENSILSLPNDQ